MFINYPPPPPPPKKKKEKEMMKTRGCKKTCHFGIIEMGVRVVQMYHLFCPRLQIAYVKRLTFYRRFNHHRRYVVEMEVALFVSAIIACCNPGCVSGTCLAHSPRQILMLSHSVISSSKIGITGFQDY